MSGRPAVAALVSAVLVVVAVALLAAGVVSAVTEGFDVSLLYTAPAACVAYAAEIAANEYRRRLKAVEQLLEARLALQKAERKEKTPQEGRL